MRRQDLPLREEHKVQTTIRRVSLSSLGRHGCVLGLAAAVLPSLACALLLLVGAYQARSWLEGWRALSVKLLGQEIARFDLVHFLGLERFLEVLRTATSVSGLTLLVTVVCLALASGLLLGGAMILVGLAYNGLALLTGGVVVETSTRTNQDHRPDDR